MDRELFKSNSYLNKTLMPVNKRRQLVKHTVKKSTLQMHNIWRVFRDKKIIIRSSSILLPGSSVYNEVCLCTYFVWKGMDAYF